MNNYELVEGLDRPEYILKNGKALNIYGAKKILEAQQQEIAELKSMVNALRRAADLYHGGYKVSELEEAAAIMNMSPAQCLQSEKADAVKEFGHEIGLYDSEYDDQEYIEVSRYSLREHIEHLREGKS